MSVGSTVCLSCVSPRYCSGRGVCRAGNSSVCDCWDPVRWSGDRCQVSVCGEHGLVVGGDYTAGTLLRLLTPLWFVFVCLFVLLLHSTR